MYTFSTFSTGKSIHMHNLEQFFVPKNLQKKKKIVRSIYYL